MGKPLRLENPDHDRDGADVQRRLAYASRYRLLSEALESAARRLSAGAFSLGTLGQDRRRVFGVRFADEETRAARQVERVGATGVVGCDLGRDSRRGEHRLGKLCIASRGIGADLDHRRYSAGTASGFPALCTAATSTSVVGVRVSTSISRRRANPSPAREIAR